MLASIGTWLEHLRGPTVYVVCGLLVFGETAVMLGFFIPGEIAAVAGGAIAALGHANVVVMIVVVVVCAIGGALVGYEVGKIMGPYLLERRPLRDNAGVAKVKDLLARHGGPAVFVGRWVAIGRPLVPGLTGMSGVRYRSFFFYNALGGALWGTGFVLLGYAAGRSWQAIATRVGTYGLIVVGSVAAVIVAVLLVWELRKRSWRPRPTVGPVPEIESEPGPDASGKPDDGSSTSREDGAGAG